MIRFCSVILIGLVAMMVGYNYAVTGTDTGRSLNGVRALGRSGTGGPTTRAAATTLAGKQPLNAEAYYVAGIDAALSGNKDKSEKLIAHSIRLDPRFDQAHVWMLQRLLATGRIEDGVNELGVIFLLQPEFAGPLSTAIASASGDPSVRRALKRTFLHRPELLGLAASAAAAGRTPTEVLDLIGGTNLASYPGGLGNAQQQLMSGYLGQGRYFDAHTIWIATLPHPPTNAIYDGNFAGLVSAPPFGWQLTSNADLEAHSIPSQIDGPVTALEVQPYNSGILTAAVQYLVLKPGKKTLRFLVRTAGASSVAYSWRIQCQSGKLIDELPITTRSTGWEPHEWQFEVSPDCPVQILRLNASPRDAKTSSALDVTRVAISS